MSAPENVTSSPPPSRTEHIYVLYGSQTGNSEQAAKEFCAQVPTRLSPEALLEFTGGNKGKDSSSNGAAKTVTVTASHMQLDDFLELTQCQWTRLIVIITSSYGIGQAPLGCYRFRDLCDAWMDPIFRNDYELLEGVKYAMCGLGDSKYTTFFRNPTVIDSALQMVGAERIGELGKADASGVGDQAQGKVIEEWMDGIWKDLAQVVVQEPLSPEKLRRMQLETIKLCRNINPEFPRPEGEERRPIGLLLALLVAILAVVASYYLL